MSLPTPPLASGAGEPAQQHASHALHDDRVGLEDLALVDQHALRDLPQHARLLPLAAGRVDDCTAMSVTGDARQVLDRRG